MKKISFLAAAVFGFALTANAQAPFGLPVTAIGYDGVLNQVTARLPLGADNLDVGFGINLNTATGVQNSFAFGVSALYIKNLNTWGPVANNLAAGGWLVQPPNTDLALSAFAGLQPELTLMERFVLSTRVGLQANLVPDFQLFTTGDQISVVQSIRFMLKF